MAITIAVAVAPRAAVVTVSITAPGAAVLGLVFVASTPTSFGLVFLAHRRAAAILVAAAVTAMAARPVAITAAGSVVAVVSVSVLAAGVAGLAVFAALSVVITRSSSSRSSSRGCGHITTGITSGIAIGGSSARAGTLPLYLSISHLLVAGEEQRTGCLGWRGGHKSCLRQHKQHRQTKAVETGHDTTRNTTRQQQAPRQTHLETSTRDASSCAAVWGVNC